MANKGILIVDGDKNFSTTLARFLKQSGYDVYNAYQANEVMDFCVRKVIDLVIMELSLPDKDGLFVIKRLKDFKYDLPIIVLSNRTNTESKVLAFDTGCNDYITKPHNNYELIARIKNQLRERKKEEDNIFINGPLKINHSSKQIFIDDKEVHFTNFEYKLLTLLSSKLNRTISYDNIIDTVWGEEGNDQNGLRVFIAGIRRKLENKNNIILIETYVGIGYRMIKI